MKKDVKITFTLPEEVYRAAKRISEQEGVTLSHVLRRAVRTEQYLKEEERRGRKLLIDDGNTLQRLVRMG